MTELHKVILTQFSSTSECIETASKSRTEMVTLTAHLSVPLGEHLSFGLKEQISLLFSDA